MQYTLFDPAVRVPEPKDPRLDQIYIKLQKKSKPNLEDSLRFDPMAKLIVDLACGCGHNTYAISTVNSSHVMGIDNNSSAIKYASSAFRRPNLEFKVGDVYSLSRTVQNVDILMVLQSLHHFDDIDKALDEIVGVISQNGMILIQDFDRKLTAANMQATGLPNETMEEIYREMILGGDVVALLRKRWLIDDSRIPTYFSFLAAYTGEDVKTKLEERGFVSELTYDEERDSFRMISRKANRLERMEVKIVRRLLGLFK